MFLMISNLNEKTENIGSLILTHQYTINRYITFSVCVNSGLFSGESNFCISFHDLKKGIEQLQNNYKTLSGICRLQDSDSDDFIIFEMQKHGKMIVSGQVGGSHSAQYLVYQFESDQTELEKIIKNLLSFLKT